MDDWVKNLLANQGQMQDNGSVKPETINRLQEFADKQKQHTKDTQVLGEIPNAPTGAEAIEKIGSSMANAAKPQPKMVTDKLEGITIMPDSKLKLDDIGKLGQEAYKDKDNMEFAKQLNMFQRRG